MDTILAGGATGEPAERLIALLQAAGYPIGESATEVTPRAMAAVRQAQTDLGILEPAALTAAELGEASIQGALVGQATWDALRAAAAKRTGLQIPQPAQETQPPAEAAATAAGETPADAGEAPEAGPSTAAQPATGGVVQ